MSNVINELVNYYTTLRNQAIVDANERIANRQQNDSEFDKLYQAYKLTTLQTARARHNGTDLKKAKADETKKFNALNNYLAKTNESLADFEPKFKCAKCQDTGRIGNEYCDCFKARLNERLTKIDGVNAEHTFANSRHPAELKAHYDKVMKWCTNYPKTKVRNINLLGYTGTGKTYLLECIANELAKKGFSVQYTTAFNLNNQCRNYHVGKASEIQNYIDADILLIDDLGSEPVLKNVTVEYLYTILNERLVKNRATCISSNLDSPTKILDRYGERIYSRLANKLLSLNILFTGKDNRTQK